jgi:3-deoxy-manno-octulosonate cytidylyltransferase (CMP-KDO synthetase)
VRILCVIPARLGSTRISQKPLRLIAGEPLICLVTKRILDFDLGLRVLVATDDPRISAAVSALPVETLITSPNLGSGTARVAAVIEHAAYAQHQVVLNVQGDEPLIERQAVTGALHRVTTWGDDVGTAAAPLESGALWDSHRVKVTVDGRGRALAFFRTPQAPACARRDAVFQHLGVYAYRVAALRRWVGLPPTVEEARERLEQLRPLAHGFRIGVAVQSAPAAPSVDTEEDVREVESRLTVPTWG